MLAYWEVKIHFIKHLYSQIKVQLHNALKSQNVKLVTITKELQYCSNTGGNGWRENWREKEEEWGNKKIKRQIHTTRQKKEEMKQKI